MLRSRADVAPFCISSSVCGWNRKVELGSNRLRWCCFLFSDRRKTITYSSKPEVNDIYCSSDWVTSCSVSLSCSGFFFIFMMPLKAAWGKRWFHSLLLQVCSFGGGGVTQLQVSSTETLFLLLWNAKGSFSISAPHPRASLTPLRTCRSLSGCFHCFAPSSKGDLFSAVWPQLAFVWTVNLALWLNPTTTTGKKKSAAGQFD